MGQEIGELHFQHDDFEDFQKRLEAETDLLGRWFDERRLAAGHPVAGFELEAWLVDDTGAPLAANEQFLEELASPFAVAELARFNIEVNGPARVLRGSALSDMHDDMARIWERCTRAAAGIGARLLMIGTHPFIDHSLLTLANVTDSNRYRALNEQVMRLRRGRALILDIAGKDRLVLSHHDLTFESAATSFQVHLQVPPGLGHRVFNASLLASGPIAAASANSPFLFGRDLWAETRIPLFEQAVAVDPPRVTFGSGFCDSSLFECFRENIDAFPVLLPMAKEGPKEELHHLRLHNGTIWRWNRPLVGFDGEGRPHLRIEHRVLPSGPTIADNIANAALYFGLVWSLAAGAESPLGRLSFGDARENFYRCVREGLSAEVRWRGGEIPVSKLIEDEILPLAAAGLDDLGVDGRDRSRYLGIVEERVRSGLNGAAWQRRAAGGRAMDLEAMLGIYCRNQQSGAPVHEWER